MFGRSTTLAGVLVVSATAILVGGTAGAKSAEILPGNETQVTKQQAMLEGGERRPTGAGSRVDATQARPGAAPSRLEARRESAAASRTRFEERARAAHKGEDSAGITLVLGTLFDRDGIESREVLGGLTARMLDGGRESVEYHRDSQRALKDTRRQRAQKKQEYEQAREDERDRAEELRRREGQSEGLVGGFGTKKERTEVRIAQLEASDRAGLFDRPPASVSGGQGPATREQELEIAHEDIVAYAVEPIPYERYVQIYKTSAKRYGFAKDWYVLAAVGKTESDHGENMGPSSAGALGPMQFLPSTWKGYGVDGDGDGVANIMNPADAIPAAAKYLRDGGAPNDWYKALYTYNRSGAYVRKVLGVAEGYRRLAKDDAVDPYVSR